jgi:hypothetical protein
VQGTSEKGAVMKWCECEHGITLIAETEVEKNELMEWLRAEIEESSPDRSSPEIVTKS